MSIKLRNKTVKNHGTYLYEGFPLIRMNSLITRSFFVEKFRRVMADNWFQKYGRQGVGLCNAELQLIAWLRPDGSFFMLPPPFKTFEMWQMANTPKVGLCACRNYFDPEVQGPWSERGLPPWHHHPHCQFSRTSRKVFKDSADSANARISTSMEWVDGEWVPKKKKNAGLTKAPMAQTRPDEWLHRQLEADEAGDA